MPKLFGLSGSEALATFASSLILLLLFGFRQSFGLFLLPITKDNGWGNYCNLKNDTIENERLH